MSSINFLKFFPKQNLLITSCVTDWGQRRKPLPLASWMWKPGPT